jgi:hypothetical protein
VVLEQRANGNIHVVSDRQLSQAQAAALAARLGAALRHALRRISTHHHGGPRRPQAEVKEGSSADKTGLVTVGDQLIACSGITYSKESDYGEVSVKMGQQVVRVSAINQVRAGRQRPWRCACAGSSLLPAPLLP